MSKSIVILSGKGGVGKSTITSNIILTLNYLGKKVMGVDCDVDASNLSLVLYNKNILLKDEIFESKKAFIDYSKCNSCKKCYENCYFNAIDWINNKPEINLMKCEGCNVCAIVCNQKAITLKKIKNGDLTISEYSINLNDKNKIKRLKIPLISAQLLIGESGSGKLVDFIKTKAKEFDKKNKLKLDFFVLDSAAGVSCPVISAVNGSDLALIIVEPTPTSLEDMKRSIKIVKHFKIPFFIIINKYDLNLEFSKKIQKEFKNKIIALIPFDKIFVESLIDLKIIESFELYKKKFINIANFIIEKTNKESTNKKTVINT